MLAASHDFQRWLWQLGDRGEGVDRYVAAEHDANADEVRRIEIAVQNVEMLADDPDLVTAANLMIVQPSLKRDRDMEEAWAAQTLFAGLAREELGRKVDRKDLLADLDAAIADPFVRSTFLFFLNPEAYAEANRNGVFGWSMRAGVWTPVTQREESEPWSDGDADSSSGSPEPSMGSKDGAARLPQDPIQ